MKIGVSRNRATPKIQEFRKMLDKSRICYILSAMEIGDLRICPDEGDLVIAADAGVRHLDALGLRAGLIVGDFDSLGKVPRAEKDRLVVHPIEKDDTDTLLAVREGLARGYHEFVIAGALGGRLDHTLANLQTLAFLEKSSESVKNHGYLIGDGKIIALLSDESITFHAGHSGVLSLFCVGDRAEVTIEGLKYPLDRYPMTPDFPIGVSNEFIGEESKITIKNGRVWLILDGSLAEISEIIRNRNDL